MNLLINMENNLYTHSECLFCGNAKFKHFDSVENWNIEKCGKCGYTFTNPRPTLEELPKFYDFNYFKDERHYKKFFNEDGSLRQDSDDYYNRIKIIESCVTKRGKILELGAAYGDFLVKLRDRGWETFGIEISEDAVKIAQEKNNINIYNGTLETFETNEKFDVICMFQTLEHLANPKYIIEKSYQLLNLGGIIVIEVPNVKAFDLKINKERKILSYDLPRHLSHFSPTFLQKRLHETKFTIISIDRYYPNFILNLFKKRNYKTIQNEKKTEETIISNDLQIELLKDNTTWKGKLINKISILFSGWKFTIIAKKTN